MRGEGASFLSRGIGFDGEGGGGGGSKKIVGWEGCPPYFCHNGKLLKKFS